MGDGLCIWKGCPDRICGTLNDDPVKIAIEARVTLDAEVLDDFLCREIASRRIMLVQGVQRDPPGHGSCRFCQCRAEDFVALVGNAIQSTAQRTMG